MTRRPASLLLLALAIAMGAAGWWFFLRSDPDDAPPPPKRLLAATSTYALLVGCTEYPTLQSTMDAVSYEANVRLEGPENDVQLLRTTLRDYLGVPEAHITVLAGWPQQEAARPTKANILAHLARLSREVPKGGRVVFQFAGHGSQEPDQEQGDELDRLDELLLPADVEKWDRRIGAVPGSISDDELRAALSRLVEAGLSVWAILDCCHAGTAVRGSQVRMRELSPSVLGVPDAPVGRVAVPQSVLRDTAAPLSSVVAFYAVQSNQLAPEMVLPLSKTARHREPHGLLTFLLSRTLMRFGGALTFRELFRHVQAAYDALPYPGATPNAEGDLELIVSTETGAESRSLLLERDATGWSLDGGSLRGLTTGSIVEAFRPGGLGDPARRVGTLTVGSVGVLRSALLPVAGDFPTGGDLPARLPGRLTHVAAGDVVVRLAVVDPEGRALPPEQHPAALRLVLAEPVMRARLPLVAPGDADWWLAVHPFDGTRADGADRLALLPRRSGGVARETDADALEKELCWIFGSAAQRRIVDTALPPTLPTGVQASLAVERPGAADPVPFVPGSTLQPGDRFVLTVRNESYKDAYVLARYFDASDEVADLGPAQVLTAADTGDVRLARGTLLDDVFGEVRLVVLAGEAKPGSAPPALGDVGCASQVNRPQGVTTRGPELVEGPLPGTASFAWRIDWGKMGIPSIYNEGRTELVPPAVVGRAAGSGESALPGEGVRWTSARVVPGDGSRADLLLLWGDGGLGACVDADGDARMADRPTADLARDAAAGRLPVEVTVLLLASGERAARYRNPVSVEGTELVLLDTRGALPAAEAWHGDAQADRRWVLRDDTWNAGPAWGPWLSASHLGSAAGGLDATARGRVTAALRTLARTYR